jgi:hypothetical protein
VSRAKSRLDPLIFHVDLADSASATDFNQLFAPLPIKGCEVTIEFTGDNVRCSFFPFAGLNTCHSAFSNSCAGYFCSIFIANKTKGKQKKSTPIGVKQKKQGG